VDLITTGCPLAEAGSLDQNAQPRFWTGKARCGAGICEIYHPRRGRGGNGAGYQQGAPYKNVVFTEGDPGHWSPQIAKLHIPDTAVAGSKLTIKTPHPMSQAHYIVSHTVLGDGTFLSRKTFAYTDQPVSEHTLPASYKGKVTVISTCNQHDWWAKSISV
jgi:superoxide reductase